jgi:hypothetical protein
MTGCTAVSSQVTQISKMFEFNCLFVSDIGVSALDPGSLGTETEKVETAVDFKLPDVIKKRFIFENERRDGLSKNKSEI